MALNNIDQVFGAQFNNNSLHKNIFRNGCFVRAISLCVAAVRDQEKINKPLNGYKM